MDALLDVLETLCRLVLAIAAGAAIGWEREKEEKPAGLRTHMLVSLGACAFMVAAIEFCDTYGGTNALDPLRVAAAIIGGVGFLGAGTIIQSRGSVRGITTAASIWVAAAIGTACGMGFYKIAVMCVVLSLTILVVGFLEQRLFKSNSADSDAPDK